MSTAHVSRLINRELVSLRDELLAYPNETDMWNVPKGVPNSAGNLALHLIGNLRFFIGTQLGATGYVRDRDAEFAKTGVPRAAMVKEIETTADEVTRTLATLDPAALDKPFAVEIGGNRIQTGMFLQHLASHLAYHLGQIDYHRRVVTGSAHSVGALPVPSISMTK
ncbi:MAG TPA: DinB family protein [Gemmatimonadaceae bacterium]|jgi:hypothetical protein